MRPIVLFLAATLASPAFGQYNNIYKQSAWAERDRWQQPERIIEATGIQPGSVIADIGCHEGYMTVKFASVVGENGKVYAVDVNQYRLDKLEDYLQESAIHNVVVVKGDYDHPNLPINTLDVAFILDSYHEMNDYGEMLRHIKASLKQSGKLVIIEPIAEERESWERSRQTGRHEIAIRYVEQELRDAGYTIIKRDETFLDRKEEKGDKLWLLIALKD